MNVILSPEAVADLDGIHAYIFRFNPDAADRVLAAAFNTFDHLARTPGLGRLRDFSNPTLRELRSSGIQGFKNYVVFYRTGEERLEIVRVLHGARDLQAIFGAD